MSCLGQVRDWGIIIAIFWGLYSCSRIRWR